MRSLYAFWKSRRWFRVAVEVAVFAAVFFGVRAYQQRDMPRGPAPPIVARTLAGEPFNLAANDGRVTLIHFWATWCPICRSEEGSIAAIAKDYRVVAVAMQSGSDAEVAQHARKQQWPVAIINDTGSEWVRAYGIRGVPTDVVVDARGDIRSVEVGYTTELGLRLRLWWYRR